VSNSMKPPKDMKSHKDINVPMKKVQERKIEVDIEGVIFLFPQRFAKALVAGKFQKPLFQIGAKVKAVRLNNLFKTELMERINQRGIRFP
jgi:hypothetical protein